MQQSTDIKSVSLNLFIGEMIAEKPNELGRLLLPPLEKCTEDSFHTPLFLASVP